MWKVHLISTFFYESVLCLGNIEPHRAFKMMETGYENCCHRSVQQHGIDVFDMDAILKGGKLLFIVTGKLELLPEMYVKADDFLYQPVPYRQYLNRIGRTTEVQFPRKIC